MVGLAALDFKQGVELLRGGGWANLRLRRLEKGRRLHCISQQSESLTLSW